jgi:hypothetical protein
MEDTRSTHEKIKARSAFLDELKPLSKSSVSILNIAWGVFWGMMMWSVVSSVIGFVAWYGCTH